MNCLLHIIAWAISIIRTNNSIHSVVFISTRILVVSINISYRGNVPFKVYFSIIPNHFVAICTQHITIIASATMYLPECIWRRAASPAYYKGNLSSIATIWSDNCWWWDNVWAAVCKHSTSQISYNILFLTYRQYYIYKELCVGGSKQKMYFKCHTSTSVLHWVVMGHLC